MHALADQARRALLVPGPVVFQHGTAQQIAAYSGGIEALTALLDKLQVTEHQQQVQRQSRAPNPLRPASTTGGKGAPFYNLVQLIYRHTDSHRSNRDHVFCTAPGFLLIARVWDAGFRVNPGEIAGCYFKMDERVQTSRTGNDPGGRRARVRDAGCRYVAREKCSAAF